MARKQFFDTIRPVLFPRGMSQSQVEGIDNLLDVWCKYMLDESSDDLAYNLATAYHETDMTMQPITERGARSYFNKYEPGTKLGKILGNTQPGDGYRFRGEGHVQNTGRRNAQKATTELNKKFNLGVDLVSNPDQRGEPLVSALSLFVGNKEGWWTGKGLDDYIDGIRESDAEDMREFIKARYVVNGTDKAEAIAKYAMVFRSAISAAGGVAGLMPEQAPNTGMTLSHAVVVGAVASAGAAIGTNHASIWDKLHGFVSFLTFGVF